MSAKKKKITIMIGIEAIIIAAVIIFLIYINSDTAKAKRQLELAQRCLSGEDYEQAVAAFEEILGIDPKNEEAYLGLAEAYAATDDLQGAVSTLEEASRKGGSEKILTMLEVYTEELEQREQAAQRAAEAEAAAAEAASQPEDMAEQTSEPESETVLTGFIVQDDDWYYYDFGNYVTGWFEENGSRYYADSDGRLYRNGEYEIDGTKYEFDPWAVCLGEVEDDAWKQAYIDIISNCESEGAGKYNYDLIYFDDDNVPELLVEKKDECYILLYTYTDIGIDVIMEDGYGTWGRSYDYFERKSVIGLSSYYIDQDRELQVGCYEIYKVDKEYEFTDSLYSESGVDDDNSKYFTYNGREISEEEYDSYLQNEFHIFSQTDAKGLFGMKEADVLIQEILSH